jgi:hypothetical protein
MPVPVIVPSTAVFTWVDATKNTDGSNIVAGEVTGFVIGIRSTTVAGSVAGTYPINSPSIAASAVSEAVSLITPSLQPDNYAAAIKSTGPVPSAWSTEVAFAIAQPVPAPPTGFSVA